LHFLRLAQDEFRRLVPNHHRIIEPVVIATTLFGEYRRDQKADQKGPKEGSAGGDASTRRGIDNLDPHNPLSCRSACKGGQ